MQRRFKAKKKTLLLAKSWQGRRDSNTVGRKTEHRLQAYLQGLKQQNYIFGKTADTCFDTYKIYKKETDTRNQKLATVSFSKENYEYETSPKNNCPDVWTKLYFNSNTRSDV